MEIFYGFFFGTLSMLSLYNLHWYQITKEKAYLYYSIKLILFITITLQNSRIIEIHQFFLILNANCIFIIILLFSKEFLSLKNSFKRINSFMDGAIIFVVLCFIYSLYTGDFDKYSQAYSLVFSPLVFISYYVYRSGFQPAIYYTVGWGISLLFVGIYDMNTFKTLEFYPEIPFDNIGNLIQAIIVTYAIFVKTNLIIKEKDEQSKILIHQAKLASMGQMLENISHQWRQPLNRIATYIINMQIHIKDKYSVDDYLEESLNESQMQLEYMSKTIDDFTNFNRQIELKEEFLVSDVVASVYKIISKSLEENDIEFELKAVNDFSIISYPGELAQVILNLLQNSQDVLMKREIDQAKIIIVIDSDKICIQDNAGGVEASVIEHIFEPYFTTKKDKASLGLGLYICKIILEKYFNARIEVTKTKASSSFDILFDSYTTAHP